LTPQNNTLSDILSNRPEGFANVYDVGREFDEIRLIFEKISNEFSSTLPLKNEMLEHLSGVLLVTLNRLLPHFEHNELVSKIKHTFEHEFSKNYTLEALSREFSVSPSKLSHEFKRVTGMSVMEYLISCRIANAKRLLCETGLGIGDIVEECGFSDGSNFSRTFKSLEGLSPKEFRIKYAKS
jgi:AraC-like DNA-binding protein